MRRYHSDNKNYNAILDAMAEIRHNQLNESYIYEGEHEDEEMAEEMDDEEAEAIAEMMDEALYEMDMEDDEDNLTEADGDRKQRRRNRLRQALLIGAGLAAAGLGGAAYARGSGMRAGLEPGIAKALPGGLKGVLRDISVGGQDYLTRGSRAARDAADAATTYAATQLDRGQRALYNRGQRAAVNKGAMDDFGSTFGNQVGQFDARRQRRGTVALSSRDDGGR